MDNITALAELLEGNPYSTKRSILEDLGFELIGSGSFKQVYHSPEFPFVVKLHDTDGCNGAQELRNYETAPAELLPFLLPILHQGTSFQMQEYVKFHQCPATCRGWLQLMYDSSDNNHTHRADGTLVIVDYGQDDQWNRELVAA